MLSFKSKQLPEVTPTTTGVACMEMKPADRREYRKRKDNYGLFIFCVEAIFLWFYIILIKN